jgi:protein-S-isoprenylcysteine O-methyltransferase Ste14
MLWTINGLMWLLWGAYWGYAARKTRKTVHRESRWGRLQHLTLFVLAVVLMNSGLIPSEFLNHRIVPADVAYQALGCAITALGLGWAIWARVHLGSYWSGEITLKEGHKLIQSGPYAITRHPIYTGLLTAIFGSSVAQGETRGFIAMALVFAAIIRKSSVEEELMMSQFPEDYKNYRLKVNRLFPGI